MQSTALIRFATLLFAIFAALHASAQQMPQPTEHHKQLANEAGVWNASCKVWIQANGEPLVSTGKETCTMLGELWLVSKYEGEFFGQAFTGYGQTGYEAESGEYVSTWIDSMTPDLFVSRGKYDAATKTLTLQGKGRDAMSGKLEEMKTTVEYPDKDHKNMVMYHQVDGEWVKTMEIAYVRAK